MVCGDHLIHNFRINWKPIQKRLFTFVLYYKNKFFSIKKSKNLQNGNLNKFATFFFQEFVVPESSSLPGTNEALLFFQKSEQTALFLFLLSAVKRRYGIACIIYDLFQLILIERCFSQDDRLLFRMGGCDLFDFERSSDRVVYVAFTHSAHHSVNSQCNLKHSYHPFCLRQTVLLSK